MIHRRKKERTHILEVIHRNEKKEKKTQFGSDSQGEKKETIFWKLIHRRKKGETLFWK